MQDDQQVLQRYVGMNEAEKIQFLSSYIEDVDTVSEQVLINVIESESSPLIKWFAVKGLGIRQSKIAVSYLTRLCREPEQAFENTSLHAICAWSLGRIGMPAFDAVMSLLNDPSIESRRCAVDALGEIGNPLAIDALCKSLMDDEYQVQLWAALSLSKIGKDALPCLHSIVKNCDPQLRLIILDAIIKVGSDESLPFLKNYVSTGSEVEKRFIYEIAPTLLDSTK